jgi:hypothetical protein
MEIVERIAVTSVALMAFDWVLQFQVQLVLGLGSDSGAPRPYKVGPASKLISRWPFFSFVLMSRYQLTKATSIFGLFYLLPYF